MTSTEFTIGLSDARSSSKVLKPPGGGSSDIFGTQSSQSQPTSRNAASTQSRLFGSSCEPQPASVKPNRMKSTIFNDVPAGSPKSSARKFVSRNPITGEVIEIQSTNGSEDEEAVQDDTVASVVSDGIATNGTATSDLIKDNTESDTGKNNGTEVENKVTDPVTGGGDGPELSRPACIRIKNPPGGKSSGIF